MTCLALIYGKKPIMYIVPDDRQVGMWRILSPDGALCDMVNIARAKDAAKTIAARKISTATAILSPSRLHWIKANDPAPEGERKPRSFVILATL